MIFDIKQKKNKFLEEVYKNSMKELNEFYGINWVYNLPKVFVVNNRKEIDYLWGKKTPDWLVAWSPNGTSVVYVLDFKKIKKESSHKEYPKEKYIALIKHELSHLFFNILSPNGYRPTWVKEGLSIYTSNQNKFKKRPEKFSQFLSFYDLHMSEDGKTNVYYESGFFIEMLFEKFGKEKLLNFLKSLQKVKDRKEFDNLFFKTYKFKLNYKEINKIYQS